MANENLTSYFEESIRKNWSSLAFSDYEGEGVTYEQVAHKVLILHHIFKKHHVKKGDKIALVGRNSMHWAITYIATVSYGAVIVPILPDFHPDDIHYIINHSDSVFVFAAKSIYETLDFEKMTNIDASFSLNDFSLLDWRKKALQQIVEKAESGYMDKSEKPLTAERFALPAADSEDIAAIVYTSGTTSFSKGVILTHRSLAVNVSFALRHLPLVIGNRVVSFLPLAHAYGCAFEFLYPFALGCHVTFISKIPTPTLLIKAFQEVKPGLILAVPLIMEKIYRKQIRPVLNKPIMKFLLKLPVVRDMIQQKIKKKLMAVFGGSFYEIVIGGAALNEEVENFFKEIKFPYTVGYGMTECGPLISYSHWDVTAVNSVGRVIDSLEIKIESEEPRRIVGEICVRGRNVMNGYYKNEEATRDAIDKEGWLHTGDLGIIDEQGFIYIKGRCKSMLLGPSGQNIYPEEIEAKLNNLPCVQESVIIERSEKLVGLVYPEMEIVEAKGLSEKDLAEVMESNRKKLNTMLPAYAAVSKIELYPREFEKTPSKKIKRFLYTIISAP